MSIKSVKIQVLQPSGTWLTVGTTVQNVVLVQKQVEAASKVYKRTARAIASDDSVIHIQQYVS